MSDKTLKSDIRGFTMATKANATETTETREMDINDKVYVVPEIGHITKIATVRELDGETIVTKTMVTVQYASGAKTFNRDALTIAFDLA